MTRSNILQNPLFRLLFYNGLAGVLAAAIVTGGLLILDVGGLGSLVIAAENPFLPILMLFAGHTITLASVAMGVAVMRLPAEPDGSDPRSVR